MKLKKKCFMDFLKLIPLFSIGCIQMVISGSASSTIYASDITDSTNTYAIICESTSYPLSIHSENTNIDGLVYSNCGIDSTTNIENQKNNSTPSYVTNFSAQLMSFENEVINHQNDYSYSEYITEISTFGLMNISADCYKLSISELFGANENVIINSSIIDSTSKEQESIIFSSNSNITLNADIVDFDGIIYAPNGTITINANAIDICGVIIANNIEINSKSCSIISNPDIFNKYNICFYTLNDKPTNIDIMSAEGSSSGNSNWYYNTGFEIKQQASYSKYNLLSTVKRGDIIHENRSSSPSMIVGHVACIEGITFIPVGLGRYIYNIRLIEAISSGVCRSVLDDTRCDDNKVVLLRYDGNLSASKINSIFDFLIKQLGKEYVMDCGRGTSEDEEDWYCSELIWAAYKSVGIDIEDGNFGAITPGDIKDCNNTLEISYK